MIRMVIILMIMIEDVSDMMLTTMVMMIKTWFWCWSSRHYCHKQILGGTGTQVLRCLDNPVKHMRMTPNPMMMMMMKKNTKSSSSTALLEASIFAFLVQSRRHLDDDTYCHNHHQDHQDHHHHDHHENDLYVDASRALEELKICLSSLRSPQFQSPHSTFHTDDDDDDGDDDDGDDNDEEDENDDANLSTNVAQPTLFTESTSRSYSITLEALDSNDKI